MPEKLYIIPHQHKIAKIDRNQQKGHNSMVLWLTGLSGSGKSTLANLLEQELMNAGINTYILDGDNIRSGLNKDLDFSEQGRIENIRRIGEVAALFVDAGVVVITAFISPFRSDRQLARQLAGPENFVEVFVECPLEICEQRDVKGLYKKARAGEIKNFTGIDSPFEYPESADVVVHTHAESTDQSVSRIMGVLKERLLVEPAPAQPQ
jgi:adenylylsulfate kinase